MVPEQKAAYVEVHEGRSCKELVTGYDPGVLWFDGEWSRLVTKPTARISTTMSAA